MPPPRGKIPLPLGGTQIWGGAFSLHGKVPLSHFHSTAIKFLCRERHFPSRGILSLQQHSRGLHTLCLRHEKNSQVLDSHQKNKNHKKKHFLEKAPPPFHNFHTDLPLGLLLELCGPMSKPNRQAKCTLSCAIESGAYSVGQILVQICGLVVYLLCLGPQ